VTSSTRPEPHRLLHRDSSRGYTPVSYLAMHSDPGEAISEEEQTEMSRDANSVFDITRAEEKAKKETRSRCNRLREAEIAARRKCIDVHRHISQIERELGLMEQLIRPAA
jgi:hypothetical protein